MAEQKRQKNLKCGRHLHNQNILIKNKKTIIGAILAIIIIIAGIVMYKNLPCSTSWGKSTGSPFKGTEYFEAMLL